MYIDTSIAFLPPGNPQSMVSGAGTSIQVGNIIDLAGAGLGVAVPNIIGNATVFGTDFGIGAVKMQVEAVVGTAFTTSTSATLELAFQGAIDNGSNQPGTWINLVTTGPIAASSLTASTIFARFDFPPVFPVGTLPRFIRLYGIIPAATDFTAGTISYAIVVPARDDAGQKYAQRNYVAQSVA